MINLDSYEPDPDDLTRGELAELAHLPWSDLAEVLDEWEVRIHGMHSSAHGVGLFLDLLGERGWEITRKPEQVTLPPTE